jgi:hypothetical protein
MYPLLNRIQSAMRSRVAYRRTVNAIRNLPVDVALDLDLYPGDAEIIARRAVYGRGA